MVLPAHVPQEILGGLDHVLARRIFVRRPVEAQMLDRIFGGAAAGADARFLLEEFGVARGPQHFIDGRRDMVMGAD